MVLVSAHDCPIYQDLLHRTTACLTPGLEKEKPKRENNRKEM
jgi:hypothetical protein